MKAATTLFTESEPTDLYEAARQAARAAYTLQKRQLVALLADVAGHQVEPDTCRDHIIQLVHNISGTATYFDEGPIGDLCGPIELRLRSTEPFITIRPELDVLGDRLASSID